MGGYRVQGEFIKLSEIASTKIFCPRGGIIQEALLIEALNDTRAWRIEAGHLYLLDEKGEKIAVFEVHWLRRRVGAKNLSPFLSIRANAYLPLQRN